MIKELILYFFLIFGFFSFVEMLFKFFSKKSYCKDVYIITFYNQRIDREKIINLAKTYDLPIYVISPAFADTTESEYITDRYFNVKFIKTTEELTTEE